MSIVEAFSMSIPVIAPNLNTGVSFLVQNEITGLVYQVENSNELIKRIEELSKNEILYRKLSLSCYKFFKENLSYNVFKKKLLQV
jgi:glycosyltransferase involved in cell wall biosynthesis